jgi:hypothetical protein
MRLARPQESDLLPRPRALRARRVLPRDRPPLPRVLADAFTSLPPTGAIATVEGIRTGSNSGIGTCSECWSPVWNDPSVPQVSARVESRDVLYERTGANFGVFYGRRRQRGRSWSVDSHAAPAVPAAVSATCVGAVRSGAVRLSVAGSRNRRRPASRASDQVAFECWWSGLMH